MNVKGLAALVVRVEEYGSLLIPVVMAKLLNDVRLHIALETQDDVCKMEDLLKAIKWEVEAREASDAQRQSQ